LSLVPHGHNAIPNNTASKSNRRNPLVSRIPRNTLSGLQVTMPNSPHRRKMIYVNIAGSATIITSQDLMMSLGGICTIFNSTVQCFYSAVKVLRVKVRASCVNQSISTIQLQWLSDSSFFRPGFTSVAMSESAAQPAMLDQRPPTGCQAAQWAQSNTGNLFYVSGQGNNTGGSYAGPLVMEIDVLAVPGIVPSGPTPPTNSVSSGILGSLYCLGLAADAWIPQGVNYTT